MKLEWCRRKDIILKMRKFLILRIASMEVEAVRIYCSNFLYRVAKLIPRLEATCLFP